MRPKRGPAEILFFPPNDNHDGISYKKTGSCIRSAERNALLKQLCETKTDDLVRRLGEYCQTIAQLVTACEDIADALRFLWINDEIDTIDLDLALSFLLVAFRRALRSVPTIPKVKASLNISVLPFTDELHFLHAPMACELLQSIGYLTSSEQVDLARSEVVILTTSPVFLRAEMAPVFARRVVQIRHVSGRKQPIIVLGHFCLAPLADLRLVAADVYCQSALELPKLIRSLC